MPVKKFIPYRQSIAIHRSLEPSLLGFPIAFMLFCVILRLASQDHYLQFVVEDCPVELVARPEYFLTLLGTIPVTVNSGVGNTGVYALLYGLLGLEFLFVCGEKISWGQGYVGFQSPEFFGDAISRIK